MGLSGGRVSLESPNFTKPKHSSTSIYPRSKWGWRGGDTWVGNQKCLLWGVWLKLPRRWRRPHSLSFSSLPLLLVTMPDSFNSTSVPYSPPSAFGSPLSQFLNIQPLIHSMLIHTLPTHSSPSTSFIHSFIHSLLHVITQLSFFSCL